MALIRTHTSLLRGALACLLLLAALSPARVVLAEPTRIAVLKLTDDTADGKIAEALAEALRSALRADDAYALSDSRVSLDQLSMVNDCDPGSASCLRAIAKSLSVDGLIYGSVEGGKKSARVSLSYFDAKVGAGRTTAAEHDFDSASPDERAIADAGNSLLTTLLGRELKKESVAEPEPELTPVAAAEATEAARPTRVEPEYEDEPKASGISGQRIAGYTLLGVAAVSTGLSVLSFVQIDRAQGNDALYDYRVAIGQQNPSVKDACVEADKNERYGLSASRFSEVQDQCSAAGTYSILQFVFIGTAVVSGGLSAYLLLSDDGTASGEHAQRGGGFTLRPLVGRSSASVTARLRF